MAAACGGVPEAGASEAESSGGGWGQPAAAKDGRSPRSPGVAGRRRMGVGGGGHERRWRMGAVGIEWRIRAVGAGCFAGGDCGTWKYVDTGVMYQKAVIFEGHIYQIVECHMLRVVCALVGMRAINIKRLPSVVG
uniref:Uncharacterized protein n=1 Tax=Oryza brachyantha TaxID=4533 RepID=J3KVD9_ORYBR